MFYTSGKLESSFFIFAMKLNRKNLKGILCGLLTIAEELATGLLFDMAKVS